MVCPTKAGLAALAPRYVLYYDQWHTAVLPNRTLTAGITHVITAFANSSLFTTDPVGVYTPFQDLSSIRALFDNGTQVCMAIGGWADTVGFRIGAETDKSRELWARNVADTVSRLGYDCVDLDWEYPCGNGQDYRQVPNSQLTSEVDKYPKLLAAVKKALGSKELSIAVPGLERDMLAYTAEKVPVIDKTVDFVNVMTYDLLNRRDNFSKHHSDVVGSLSAIDTYIRLGFNASKLNLGFPFYAKHFELAANTTCTKPIGCPLALAEAADGSDTGTSGAATFEASSFPVNVDPSSLTASPDGSCGTGTTYKCTGTATQGACCSQYGFCGDTPAHCQTGCQSSYGTCTAAPTKSIAQSFAAAVANSTTDTERGGQWWVDSDLGVFWTFDTPALVKQKFSDIVKARSLGGVMAWSLTQDSKDWQLLQALQHGVSDLKASANIKRKRQSKQLGR